MDSVVIGEHIRVASRHRRGFLGHGRHDGSLSERSHGLDTPRDERPLARRQGSHRFLIAAGPVFYAAQRDPLAVDVAGRRGMKKAQLTFKGNTGMM